MLDVPAPASTRRSRQLAALNAKRAAKRIEARRRRPRCAICPNPLPYGKSGFNLRATTCSRKCAWTRYNWFKRAA